MIANSDFRCSEGAGTGTLDMHDALPTLTMLFMASTSISHILLVTFGI